MEQVPCSVCGALVAKKTAYKDRQFVCGYWCRNYLRWGAWPSSEIPAVHPIRSSLIPMDHPVRATQTVVLKTRFIVDQCLVCGTWATIDASTGGGSSRVCSKRCFRRWHRLLRRSRLAAVVTDDVHPYKIYVRDNWVCYLCGDRVDRKAVVPSLWAPTLDHVVPIVAGGGHTYENIRTAHFICNSLKRDKELTEFLASLSQDQRGG